MITEFEDAQAVPSSGLLVVISSAMQSIIVVKFVTSPHGPEPYVNQAFTGYDAFFGWNPRLKDVDSNPTLSFNMRKNPRDAKL